MTLHLSKPLDTSDALLLTEAEIHDVAAPIFGNWGDVYFREVWQRVRLAVRLREPHLTAQIDQMNAAVDDRFDWDAQIGQAA